ncbi:hypothetical protein BSI_19110 [Bacillus inaquosorum KCTC 13429]|uniref:Uncharacterized protein n=1 Tax=Bacillus inaquosorum KCTC 13429 TaxID=1236548 RepID=A0A9W5LIT2_9BACI|nr:hypothetical protein BSI_19110 [Bacillus inaquosorum KCTC 13429]
MKKAQSDCDAGSKVNMKHRLRQPMFFYMKKAHVLIHRYFLLIIR